MQQTGGQTWNGMYKIERVAQRQVLFLLTATILGVLGTTEAALSNGIYVADGVELLGCYEDEARSDGTYIPVLPPVNPQLNNFTPPTCIERCEPQKYAGLQFPGLCFCGSALRSNFTQDVATFCSGACPEQTTLFCGNQHVTIVYEVTTTTQPIPVTDDGEGLTINPAGPSQTTVPGYTTLVTAPTNTVKNITATIMTGGSHKISTISSASEVMYTATVYSTDPNLPPSASQSIVTIAGATGGAVGGLCVAAGIVGFVIRRRRRPTSKNDNIGTSLSLDEVNRPSLASHNPTFQPNPVNVDVLYAKPDKKKKNKQPQTTIDPEDPSYQDVMPTGAQHQYATVHDDPRLYDSIQDDPQYATVQKGRKQAPNVETNPLYGRGSVDNTAYDSVGPLSNDNDRAPSVCEMTDNIIYG